MLNALAETVVEFGLQTVGWVVLKVVSLGTYRGFGTRDAMTEGVVGLSTIAGACGLAYWWW